MSITLTIHGAAENELNEAADFYELECAGLGEIFIDEVERAIKSIYQFPEAFQLVRGRVRRKVLHKFPFSIIYSIRPQEIRILAVAHQKRRPFYWHGRR